MYWTPRWRTIYTKRSQQCFCHHTRLMRGRSFMLWRYGIPFKKRKRNKQDKSKGSPQIYIKGTAGADLGSCSGSWVQRFGSPAQRGAKQISNFVSYILQALTLRIKERKFYFILVKHIILYCIVGAQSQSRGVRTTTTSLWICPCRGSPSHKLNTVNSCG